MSVKDFRIKSLRFSGGEEVQLEPGSLLLLVGPNNSGKSVALREIEDWLKPSHLKPEIRFVIRAVEFQDVTVDDLFELSTAMYPTSEVAGGTVVIQMGGGKRFQLHRRGPLQAWYEACFYFLVQRLDTETRLTYANAIGRVDVFGGEPPNAGIHWLQKDEAIYRQVSATVRGAFGADLIINWGGSTTVGFHVGDPPITTVERDRVSQPYLEELNRLPRLEQLGDGIRSFVATVLAAYVGPHPIVLIDEPEAFLHPPQAARLGAVLGRLTSEQKRQAIVATHSADFIKGVLSVPGNTVICRVERSGSVNHAYALNAADIQQFWSSPLLRSSQAIAGIFHEGVVVCEADADARFYESVLSTVAPEFSRPIDLYFVHGGGKGALSTLSAAYRRLQIPTAVIADIDLLRNYSEFSAVYSALGGDPSALKSMFNEVSTQLGDQGPVLSVTAFATEFRELLTVIEAEKRVSPDSRRKGSELLENAADWSEAKKYGLDKLKGGARDRAKALVGECQKIGLFLVPKGELEGWWRDGPAGKRVWIVAAIERLNTNCGDFVDAQSFVRQICRYFDYS
jgi:ABC-type transporter Mla maintaining outer membrane lipid asymmetry ATPase subunit MlaF